MSLLENFANLNRLTIENDEIRTPNGRFFERKGTLVFADADGEVGFPIKGNPYLVAGLLERSGLCKNVRVIPESRVRAVQVRQI
jgi:hypothetical protein